MGRNGILQTTYGGADKGSLNGLRGIFSFHVMVFHACRVLGTRPKLNLYGHIDMPIFFLLSGFSLALTYGRTKWDVSSLTCRNTSTKGVSEVAYAETPTKQAKIFNAWEFYKKRMIRILPLHYLGIILGLITLKFGYLFAIILLLSFQYDVLKVLALPYVKYFTHYLLY